MEFAIVDLEDIDIDGPYKRMPCIVVEQFIDGAYDDPVDYALEVACVVVFIDGTPVRKMMPAGLLIDPQTITNR